MMTKLVIGAAYVRMSGDHQEDSPDRQRCEIKKLAAREGIEICEWYEDHGISGTNSENRPSFQRLMADAGKRKFQVVLLYEHSRLSREDVYAQMEHFRAFQAAGVEIFTCQNGRLRLDDLGGLITAFVGAHGAHEESRKISGRVTSGKMNAFRKGRRVAGGAFGFDREITDDQGKIVRRVNFRDNFSKPHGWSHRLVISSDTKAVKAVQFMYESFRNGVGLCAIARRLNDDEVRTSHRKRWSTQSVRRILASPLYIGTDYLGRNATGKFNRTDVDGAMYRENAHEAIVSVSLFNDVQRLLATSQGYAARRSQPAMLAGLVYCGHCKRPMNGISHRRTSTRKSGERVEYRHEYYSCVRRVELAASCPHPTVNAPDIDRVVIDALKNNVLSDKNLNSIAAAMADDASGLDAVSSSHRRQLEELDAKIERATQNQALAEDAREFKRLSVMIREWEDAADNLRAALKHVAHQPQLAVDSEAIKQLRRLRKEIDTLPSAVVRNAVSAFVSRIEIRKVSNTSRQHAKRARANLLAGSIVLNASIWSGGALTFETSDLSKNEKWRDVALWVANQRCGLTRQEVADHFGFTYTTAIYHLGRAVDGKLLRKRKTNRGWEYHRNREQLA